MSQKAKVGRAGKRTNAGLAAAKEPKIVDEPPKKRGRSTKQQTSTPTLQEARRSSKEKDKTQLQTVKERTPVTPPSADLLPFASNLKGEKQHQPPLVRRRNPPREVSTAAKLAHQLKKPEHSPQKGMRSRGRPSKNDRKNLHKINLWQPESGIDNGAAGDAHSGASGSKVIAVQDNVILVAEENYGNGASLNVC